MNLNSMEEITISVDGMNNRQCYDLCWIVKLELKELQMLGKCG